MTGLILAFASPASGSRPAKPARPNPQILWQAYPLTPTRTQPAPLRPAAPANRHHLQPPAHARAGSTGQRSGSAFALIAAVAGGLLLVLILPAALLRRSRGRRRTVALSEPATVGSDASAIPATALPPEPSPTPPEPAPSGPVEPLPATATASPDTASPPRPNAPRAGPRTASPVARESASRAPVQPLRAIALPLACEIKWVRGRGDGEFQAITAAPDGSRLVLARSPRFRSRLPLPPDATGRAVAAHETLVRQLVAAGWHPCGAGLLNWYAHRFRAPAPAPAEPLPAIAPPLACEIKWVRGRGDGEFQAITAAPDGSRLVLARSPRFRSRLPLPPDATGRAVAAHEALVRQLVAAGWQPYGAGLLNWYAHRFRAPETFTPPSRTETDA